MVSAAEGNTYLPSALLPYRVLLMLQATTFSVASAACLCQVTAPVVPQQAGQESIFCYAQHIRQGILGDTGLYHLPA